MGDKTIILDRYEIWEPIGAGGSSKVYRAKDIRTDCEVAIKQYKTNDINNKKRVYEDVERELDLLKNITHPALPQIFNVIFWRDNFYLIMEYVEGQTLEHLLKIRKLNKKQIYEIGQQILSAMYYLHSLEPPIIYRDLKPANVICMEDNRIKLVDFGGSKRFNKDVFADCKALGTAYFAAPEQYGDERGMGLYNTDIRTDIYGMGALLFKMTTGKNIEEGLSIIRKFMFNIKYGKKLKKVIRKATKVYPKERYQDTLEMLIEFTLAFR